MILKLKFKPLNDEIYSYIDPIIIATAPAITSTNNDEKEEEGEGEAEEEKIPCVALREVPDVLP
jgi:hypothetical protein